MTEIESGVPDWGAVFCWGIEENVKVGLVPSLVEPAALLANKLSTGILGSTESKLWRDKGDRFSILQKAVRQKDPDKFEEALNACFPMQYSEGLCKLLADMLEAYWHFRHEDVARAIQNLKCVYAVEALERRASRNPEYLVWDESHVLARKCTWALADIGTDEAKQALERLSLSEITVVRGFAQKTDRQMARRVGAQRNRVAPATQQHPFVLWTKNSVTAVALTKSRLCWFAGNSPDASFPFCKPPHDLKTVDIGKKTQSTFHSSRPASFGSLE